MINKTVLALSILSLIFFSCKKLKTQNTNYKVGQKIDSLNNVYVFYNGSTSNVVKRNTKDGYNLGLEYQCVEFVKRYYYEYYKHKMPDSYGHAKSFFIKNLNDGKINKQRNLIQFTNPSLSKPKESDLIVMKGHIFNKYGHVAIISKVTNKTIEIIQQNSGAYSSSRETFSLNKTEDDKWKIENDRILGWLRK